jgi:hypothetical protein
MDNVTNWLLAQTLMEPPQNTAQNTGPRRPFANAMARGADGFRQGFGEREVGIPAALFARYPHLAFWQPDASDVDKLVRGWSGLLREELPASLAGGTKTWDRARRTPEGWSAS